MRNIDGFDPLQDSAGVPKPSPYTRILKSLFKFEEDIKLLLDLLVNRPGELLSDFGKSLAVD